jgi:hypothetical protein
MLYMLSIFIHTHRIHGNYFIYIFFSKFHVQKKRTPKYYIIHEIYHIARITKKKKRVRENNFFYL